MRGGGAQPRGAPASIAGRGKVNMQRRLGERRGITEAKGRREWAHWETWTAGQVKCLKHLVDLLAWRSLRTLAGFENFSSPKIMEVHIALKALKKTNPK